MGFYKQLQLSIFITVVTVLVVSFPLHTANELVESAKKHTAACLRFFLLTISAQTSRC